MLRRRKERAELKRKMILEQASAYMRPKLQKLHRDLRQALEVGDAAKRKSNLYMRKNVALQTVINKQASNYKADSVKVANLRKQLVEAQQELDKCATERDHYQKLAARWSSFWYRLKANAPKRMMTTVYNLARPPVRV